MMKRDRPSQFRAHRECRDVSRIMLRLIVVACALTYTAPGALADVGRDASGRHVRATRPDWAIEGLCHNGLDSVDGVCATTPLGYQLTEAGRSLRSRRGPLVVPRCNSHCAGSLGVLPVVSIPDVRGTYGHR